MMQQKSSEIDRYIDNKFKLLIELEYESDNISKFEDGISLFNQLGRALQILGSFDLIDWLLY